MTCNCFTELFPDFSVSLNLDELVFASYARRSLENFQTDLVNFTANHCLFFLFSEQETVVLNPSLAGEQVKTTYV